VLEVAINFNPRPYGGRRAPNCPISVHNKSCRRSSHWPLLAFSMRAPAKDV
jgi:hypothetical protein